MMAEYTRLVEIIENFKAVSNQTNLQITPDALFSNARALFISEMIARQNGGTRAQTNQSVDVPATEKQLNYLKVLNIPTPEGITKRQAIILIKKATEGDNGSES